MEWVGFVKVVVVERMMIVLIDFFRFGNVMLCFFCVDWCYKGCRLKEDVIMIGLDGCIKLV